MSAYSDCKKIVHLVQTGCWPSVSPVLKSLKDQLSGTEFAEQLETVCNLDWRADRESRWIFIERIRFIADDVKGKRFSSVKS